MTEMMESEPHFLKTAFFSGKRYSKGGGAKHLPVCLLLKAPSVTCVHQNELQLIRMTGAVATVQRVNTICAEMEVCDPYL